MRKLLLLLPLIALLSGCLSKKEICARWESGGIETVKAAKKLDVKITTPLEVEKWEMSLLGQSRDQIARDTTRTAVKTFCSNYKGSVLN